MARQRYYKAIRPDGGSFRDPSFRWATKPGGVTTHPDFRKGDGARGYLSVATVPTDCTGMTWPARLLVVESVPGFGVFTPDATDLPSKRAGAAFRTVEERPGHELFGPQGEAVVALIERARTITNAEAKKLYAAWGGTGYAAWDATGHAAWDATWYAAWDAARSAARYAARYAAWNATWYAAWDATWYATWGGIGYAPRDAAGYAAGALILRDIVGTKGWTQDVYDLLTAPWAKVIGRAHPDDRDRKEA
jgi:hypothetical protein